MKLEEVKALSKKELRIKAAELVGWVDIHLHPKANLLVGYRAGHTKQQRKVWGPQPIPDYSNDIAAAQGLEFFLLQIYVKRKIEGAQKFMRWKPNTYPWARYLDALRQVLDIHLIPCEPDEALPYDFFGPVQYKDIFALVHASPLDRTRAFVLTMESDED